MIDDAPYVPQLPEHPELREVALAIESYGGAADIFDSSFRAVFISTETVKFLGLTPEEASTLLGLSLIRRSTDGTDLDVMQVTEESGLTWFQNNAPIMRHYPWSRAIRTSMRLSARPARQRSASNRLRRRRARGLTGSPSPQTCASRRFVLGDSNQIHLRLNDDEGQFLGILHMSRGPLPESLMALLGRGDERLFERMNRVSEPARRPAAILFSRP
ncbi:MAG: hypothetical protein IPK93_03685 [Solirubrobacterales bacterium]|nr:hypothetical protein [Solirubrobacterales bacterium]